MTYITAPDPVSENIFFDILLESTYWNRPPELEVVVDDHVVGQYVIDQPEFHIRFRRVMNFNQPHVLELKRTGKTNNQTRVLADGSYDTQMLCIKTVKLDNIDLRNLVWHSSYFEPEYPEPWATEQRAQGVELETQVPGEMYLGHNGLWRFEFTSPIYKFLVNWAKGNR
jgi:hypothetical protein